MRLHSALINAGHKEWGRCDTWYNFALDEIIVRFSCGKVPDVKCLQFNIPAHITYEYAVEYAKKKWPEWFLTRKPVHQLDLFNQE
jgi:hypothetical protein